MDDFKFYTVTADLTWMNGGELCGAEMTMSIYARSPGHAISRAKDQLARIGGHEVKDIEATDAARRAAGVEQ